MSQRNRTAQNTLRLMPCHAGGRSYYLDAAHVRSVQRKEQWRLNWRTDSPLGWVRDGDDELPVFDLARALGVSHTKVAENAVVVDTWDGKKAWGVGGVGRVVMMAEDRLLAVPDACRDSVTTPWLGLVADPESSALCLDPRLVGSEVLPPGISTPNASSRTPDQDQVKPARPTGRALLFSAFDGKGRLPEVRFCFGFGQIGEFITLPNVIPFPSGPGWLAGLIVWRERTVPVVNLAFAATGKPLPVDCEDYLVVRANASGDFAAVTVFGRPDTVELPLACESSSDAPPVAHPSWFFCGFHRKHELILLPDFSAIMAAR